MDTGNPAVHSTNTASVGSQSGDLVKFACNLWASYVICTKKWLNDGAARLLFKKNFLPYSQLTDKEKVLAARKAWKKLKATKAGKEVNFEELSSDEEWEYEEKGDDEAEEGEKSEEIVARPLLNLDSELCSPTSFNFSYRRVDLPRSPSL